MEIFASALKSVVSWDERETIMAVNCGLEIIHHDIWVRPAALPPALTPALRKCYPLQRPFSQNAQTMRLTGLVSGLFISPRIETFIAGCGPPEALPLGALFTGARG